MKLIYADVVSCNNEPDPQTLDEKGKEVYIFQYEYIMKIVSKTGKIYPTKVFGKGKSLIKLSQGLQFLEIKDGVFNGKYWFNVTATYKTVGK